MKLDFPEQTAEQKAVDAARLRRKLDDQAALTKQEQIRAFSTAAPVVTAKLVIDPLKVQLMAHYEALTTDYARRLAVQQLAGLAGLCGNCKKG